MSVTERVNCCACGRDMILLQRRIVFVLFCFVNVAMCGSVPLVVLAVVLTKKVNEREMANEQRHRIGTNGHGGTCPFSVLFPTTYFFRLVRVGD